MTASAALDAFHAAAPVRRLQYVGVEWHYRAAGDGRQGLLLLPGAVGDGDAYFTLAPLLWSTHRLLAIAYPSVDSLTALLDGLRYILDREGIDSTDIVGGSFGGLIAQAFLRRFPQRTRRVVLSATGPAKPERAASNEKWARVLARLPLGVTRTLLRNIVRVSLKHVTEDRAFWREFYFGAIALLSREELVTRYRLSADVDRHGPPSPAGLQEWSGLMLILEGDADKIAHSAARDNLKSLYPAARVQTFPGAGHAISAERRGASGPRRSRTSCAKHLRRTLTEADPPFVGRNLPFVGKGPRACGCVARCLMRLERRFGLAEREQMLNIQHLRKSFGTLVAVDDVSFAVERGTLVGLLGPNGAGKTTTVSMIAGLVAPEKGEVLVEGARLSGDTDPKKRRIGLVPQDLALYDELSARANLRFFGALYSLSGAALDKAIKDALDLVGLADRVNDRVSTYSGGMKRRLNLAAGLLHDPDVLLLDEPTVGVDPQSRNAIFDNLETLKARGKALIYTTHYMEEVERLADRIVVMDHGKVIAEDTLDGLQSRVAGVGGGKATLESVFLTLTGRSLRD